MSFMLLGILNSQAAGGGAAEAFDLLESTTLTSSAQSITFSGLSVYASDYKHLQIRYVSRSSIAASPLSSELRINGVAGSYSHNLQGTGSSVNSNNVNNQIGYLYNGDTTDGGRFAAGIIDILDAFSTTKNSTTRAFSGLTGSGNIRVSLSGGLLDSTSAVSSLQLIDQFDQYAATSRFSLYGSK